MHGDADTVTSFRATRELAKSIAGCTFVPWMEMYHELHHETIRDLVFNRILDWIEKNLNK
jgi:alpha-beta hydrolase superfamily lysophospholipase